MEKIVKEYFYRTEFRSFRTRVRNSAKIRRAQSTSEVNFLFFQLRVLPQYPKTVRPNSHPLYACNNNNTPAVPRSPTPGRVSCARRKSAAADPATTTCDGRGRQIIGRPARPPPFASHPPSVCTARAEPQSACDFDSGRLVLSWLLLLFFYFIILLSTTTRRRKIECKQSRDTHARAFPRADRKRIVASVGTERYRYGACAG